MKKIISLIMIISFVFAACCISAAAETTFTVETPVAMALVEEADGNYEYKVSADVTTAADTEVNIIMFGNRDNSEFISGDVVMSLTVDEIVSDYNIYYLDQLTSDSEGKVNFEFNVIFPTPAKDDLYYVRVAAMGADGTADIGMDELGVTSQIVKVSLTSSKTQYAQSESATFTANAENVFGNTVPADFSYTVTQNGTTVDKTVGADGKLSCTGLSGSYVVNATATPKDGGASVTSAAFTINVGGDVLKGDIDGNGKIAITDAVAILKHVAGTKPLADSLLEIADFNGDTKVTIIDVTAMLKYIARV